MSKELTSNSFFAWNAKGRPQTIFRQSAVPSQNYQVLRIRLIFAFLGLLLITQWAISQNKLCAEPYHSKIELNHTRTWIGPEFWANRLQDWQINKGQIECAVNKPFRTLHLLTRRIDDSRGNVIVKVKTGILREGEGSSGILIGAGASDLDYRAAATVMGNKTADAGIYAGITDEGQIFIEDFSKIRGTVYSETYLNTSDVQLEVHVIPGWFRYKINLRALDLKSGKLVSEIFMNGVRANSLIGNIALVSDGRPSWFNDWQVSGSKVLTFNERNAGPVFSSRYTLSAQQLKLAVQMMPLSRMDNQKVSLQIKNEGEWSRIKDTRIKGRISQAIFHISNWEYKKDIPYRVVYDLKTKDSSKQYVWEGVIRQDPETKEEIVVASVLGQKVFREKDPNLVFAWNKDHVWFPHVKMTKHLKKHDPDVLYFPGEQTQVLSNDFEDVTTARLDYLYRWYLNNWAFRDLTKNRPSISNVDFTALLANDSIFKAKPKLSSDSEAQTKRVLRMMMKAQMTHMPAAVQGGLPYDRVNAYDTQLVYGRMGFAIIDKNPLLSQKKGSTKKNFLKSWTENWRGQDFKVALTAYPFLDMVSHRGRKSDPLERNHKYRWLPSQREHVLKQLRKASVVALHGNPSYANVVQHGLDNFKDSVYSFSSPHIAPVTLDSWQYQSEESSDYSDPYSIIGEHADYMNNKVTVHALAQAPAVVENEDNEDPISVDHMGAGYGIVRFDREKRSITFEAWPLYSDPQSRRGERMLDGFPLTINQEDNDGREAESYLPLVEVHGLKNPVIQVVDEDNDEILYTVRMRNNQFIPKVFRKGNYTIIIGGHDYSERKVLKNIPTVQEGEEERTLSITFKKETDPTNHLSDK